MHRARPVRERGVVETGEGFMGGDGVGVVIAVEVSADGEVTELGKGGDSRRVDITVVAGEGEVETRQGGATVGGFASSGELNRIIDQGLCATLAEVEAGIGAYISTAPLVEPISFQPTQVSLFQPGRKSARAHIPIKIIFPKTAGLHTVFVSSKN